MFLNVMLVLIYDLKMLNLIGSDALIAENIGHNPAEEGKLHH